VPLLDEDYLILSTIHSAKGQEWKSVFVLNVVDGCITSDLGTSTTEELEEERRLLYVAMTRAKDDLHLSLPQRFFVHGQSAPGRSSSLRIVHAFHPRSAFAFVRAHALARFCGRREPCREPRASHRHRGAHA
jgi:superfamily I DNA/RNA helicase